MADNFLSKIRVAPGEFVELDGRPVLERHAELRALLSDRAGPEVAALFAEPLVSRGNDEAPPTVAWYAEAAGEARPLSRLSPTERDRAERYLVDHLRPLRALAEDPATAGLVRAALTVYGQDDILVLGDRPVIVNWGLMPGGGDAPAGLRAAHHARTLGRYLPLTAAAEAAGVATPAASPAPPGPATAAAVAAPPLGADAGPEAIASSAPPGGAVADRGIPRIAWVPLVVLLVLAAAALAWIVIPGNRLFPAGRGAPAITQTAALDAARALNDSLRLRKAALEAALGGAVCRPDGVLVLPDGRTPEGLTPPAPGEAPPAAAPAAPDALLPSNPGRVLVPVPGAAPQDGETPATTLLAAIEPRTVMVLAAGPGGAGMGSGFFVAPGLIVTNQHVIAGAGEAEGTTIVVAGAGLDRPRRAALVKAAGPLEQAGTDFALLAIDDPGIAPFALYQPQGTLRLTNVVAAGYPGDVLASDLDFAALQSGDPDAMPGLTVTDGTVNTEQRIAPETLVLMHSAALSSGNSGGPLVDMCGRVVGVNTFVRQGRLQNRNFALSVGDLLAFLDGTGAAPVVVTDPCTPVVAWPTPAR